LRGGHQNRRWAVNLEYYVSGYRQGTDSETDLLHVGDDPDVAHRVAEMHRYDYDLVEIRRGTQEDRRSSDA
jgi:hypothetical protein